MIDLLLFQLVNVHQDATYVWDFTEETIAIGVLTNVALTHTHLREPLASYRKWLYVNFTSQRIIFSMLLPKSYCISVHTLYTRVHQGFQKSLKVWKTFFRAS